MMIDEKSLFGLSGRQRDVLKFIVKFRKSKGYPPSIRDICKGVGLSSSSTVYLHLSTLEKKGYIRRDPSKPRAIDVLWKGEPEPEKTVQKEKLPSEKSVPSSADNQQAPEKGIPDEAVGCPLWEENLRNAENPEARPYGPTGRIIYLSYSMAGNRDAFIVRMTNDSMSGAGIAKGDYCIMHPASNVEDGGIALVESGGQLTVKKVYRHMNLYRLEPENRRMNSVFVRELKFLGRFHGLIRLSQEF